MEKGFVLRKNPCMGTESSVRIVFSHRLWSNSFSIGQLWQVTWKHFGRVFSTFACWNRGSELLLGGQEGVLLCGIVKPTVCIYAVPPAQQCPHPRKRSGYVIWAARFPCNICMTLHKTSLESTTPIDLLPMLWWAEGLDYRQWCCCTASCTVCLLVSTRNWLDVCILEFPRT